LLTGPDDATFCHRVSEALALGYRLYGSPSVTFNCATVIAAQALLWAGATRMNEQVQLGPTQQELDMTVQRMEARLFAMEDKEMQKLMVKYGELVVRFVNDLGANPRDVSLAKAIDPAVNI
jgi:hypothetical protein